MLWLKTLHLATLVCWCGALLCVVAALGRTGGHVDARETAAPQRTLFLLMATPAALLAIATGTGLFALVSGTPAWLAAKLFAVTVLAACHLLAGWALHREEHGEPLPSSPHLGLSAATASAMLGTLWLVLAKPA